VTSRLTEIDHVAIAVTTSRPPSRRTGRSSARRSCTAKSSNPTASTKHSSRSAESYIQLLTPTRDDSPWQVLGEEGRGAAPRCLSGRQLRRGARIGEGQRAWVIDQSPRPDRVARSWPLCTRRVPSNSHRVGRRGSLGRSCKPSFHSEPLSSWTWRPCGRVVGRLSDVETVIVRTSLVIGDQMSRVSSDRSRCDHRW